MIPTYLLLNMLEQQSPVDMAQEELDRMKELLIYASRS